MKPKKPAFFCLPLPASFAASIKSSFIETDFEYNDNEKGEWIPEKKNLENLTFHNSHTTLYFGKDKELIKKYADLLGKEVECLLGVIYYRRDVYCHMVNLIGSSSLYLGASYPHITIATDKDTKPKKSNEILMDIETPFHANNGVIGKKYTSRVSAAIYTSNGLEYTTDISRLKI